MTRFSKRARRGLAPILVAGLALCLLAVGPAWSAVDVADLADEVSADRLQSRIEEMAELGSRVSGYPGNEQAAEIVLDAFDELGLETYVQEFDLPTPLEKSAKLEVDGESYDIHGLWPNLVRHSAVPAEGLTGPVIYVGNGKLSDFNEMPVDGSIVVMDFNSGQHWLNVPLLDADAVVFIGPENTSRGEAETKWLRVPVDVPRFWIDNEHGDALKAAGQAHSEA
ncbi:MAG: hypothetical protein GF393_07720, partial [Armatimonadia bacterium]|nr:hypothetical protein [Armatimonadia bacterium]